MNTLPVSTAIILGVALTLNAAGVCTEFIAPPTVVLSNNVRSVLPGLYANPMGVWKSYKPAAVKEHHDNIIQCEGNGWKLKYTFLPDAIELEYGGAPEGQRGFRAGYPPAELTLNLAHNLARACDPANQSDLGWPVAHPPEPGDFAILSAGGDGFIAEGAPHPHAAAAETGTV